VDVRQYFRKLREIEAALTEPFPLVTSLENADGGKPGVVSEVSRELAAKLLVEGRVVLSTEAEAAEFWARQVAQKLAIQKADLASRLQVTIVSDPETGEYSSKKVERK
jgi:hypothetical protein